MKHLYSSGRMIHVFVLAFCLVAAGCMNVRMIAHYDEQVDKGITAFQKAAESHLTTLEGQIGKPEADYPSYVAFYQQARVDLSSLRVRASAQAKNEKTVQQLDYLNKNLIMLETMHRQGLKENDIPPLRNAFNVGATAILKLELAKKRGDD